AAIGRLAGEAEGLVAYVVTELVNNAIDHSSGNQVRVSAEQQGTLLLLEIEDDGVGVRAEDRRRVFEPYYSTKDHGTGLGLAIVSRIVADHHGYIRVHERKPTGTRFIVELPVKST
ncbi:MAG: ATP-binding protein, partial [bacterium]|nr:ATP-binding protein [bacterium]